MVFTTVRELTEALKGVATVLTDRVTVSGAPSPDLIDRLARTAAFGERCRHQGHGPMGAAAARRGRGYPLRLHSRPLHGDGTRRSRWVYRPSHQRASDGLRYRPGRDSSREALDAGAFILEIARSEIGYTEQRPHEYAAVMMAAALREGFRGPLFLQGDHVQVALKKYAQPDRDKELDALRALIREEMAACFFNIDIDTSTLVDLEKATLDEQQAVNCDLAADFTAFIREHEPAGVTVSVGGEIGEVGGKNSDVNELHAFMRGYTAALAQARPVSSASARSACRPEPRTADSSARTASS